MLLKTAYFIAFLFTFIYIYFAKEPAMHVQKKKQKKKQTTKHPR